MVIARRQQQQQRREYAPAQQQQQRQTDALVQALGEFAVFIARVRRSQQKKKRRSVVDPPTAADACVAIEEKRAVLEWLRCLSPAECSSLCAVTDVGFVKTLLSMAMLSRQKRASGSSGGVHVGSYVDEFQLLPVTSKSLALSMVDAKNWLKSDAPVSAPSTSPRDFIRRPRVRTMDGDIVGTFHLQAYSECCVTLLQFIRILNASKSCDTVTLAMELFDAKQQHFSPSQQQSKVPVLHGKNALFLYLMEQISDGQFLALCPSETTLRSKVWGETKWLASQGYYSLQALIVNQIELNIWRHWIERKKASSPLYRVPLVGLGSKLYLADEWMSADADQQREVLSRLGVAMMSYLRGLKSRSPSDSLATRSSLSGLIDVLAAFQESAAQLKARDSAKGCADFYFSCSFTETLNTPQAAVVKLIVAEQLQEQCSLLLSERLANEDEEASSPQTMGFGADESKSANHTQRRRANRKKLLKKRRHEAEERLVQQARLKAALEELKARFRKKKEQTLKSVSEILDNIVESAATEAKPKVSKHHHHVQANHTVMDLLDASSGISSKKKKKRNKGKKSGGDQKVGVDKSRPGSSSATPVKLSSPASIAAAGPVSFDEKENRSQQIASETPEVRPLLSFLDKSYSSPLPLMPTFGPEPLYTPSNASPPFFLSLPPPRDLTGRSNQRAVSRQTEELVAEEERTSNESANTSGSGQEKPSESNFEWYLPSLFSSESSNHTNSTTSSLDWDFHNWQLKNDASSTTKNSNRTLPSSTNRPMLRNRPQPAIPSSSSSKTYSLESFSNMLSADSATPTRKATSSSPGDSVAVAGETSSAEDDSPDDSGSLAMKSDFLYQQGGFFDRQRALKRRRRPLPFDYEDEECRDSGGDDDNDDDAWVEYPAGHCYRCGCHQDEADQPCECKLNADGSHQCSTRKRAKDKKPSPKKEAALVPETAEMLDRLARLEATLEEKTKALDELSSTLPKEVTTLQQTVSSLNVQLMTMEAELRELKLISQESKAASSNNSPVAMQATGEDRNVAVNGILVGGGSPPPPPPLQTSTMTQSDLEQQQQEHEIPSNEYMYSNQLVAPMDASTSVLGPFVSVPMSVLPPRTKLHWDMCEFISQLQTDSNIRLPAQMAALRLCTATVQSLWPRAQVRPYGSFVSRLVLPSSDIDLVICLPKVRRDAPADAAGVLEGRNAIKETWQQNLARKLRLEPWVVPDSVKTIPLAAIPIITLLTTAPYNVRLDISFEGPGHNGLATNDVVLSLIHEFPPLAPIMLVLKSFAIERGFAMAYSGGLSSYSLLLMVARYLQEHSDTVTNGFENVSAAVQHSISSQSCADFGMMLMGFLDFYGNRFDPRTTGISVASRCFLNRENTFLSASAKDHHQYAADDAVLDDRSAAYHNNNSGHWQMPQQSPVQDSNLLSSPGSRRYGNRSSMDWPQNTHMVDLAHDPHKFDPVFIEDPLHPSNNVGRNLFRIMQIRRAFSAAYSILMAASVNPSVFNENRTSKITGVALHPDNMLRAILGANAPVKAKSDVTGGGSSVPNGGGNAGSGLSSSGEGSQSPTNSSHMGYPTPASSGGGVGFPYPNYTHAGVPGAAHYFPGNGGGGGAAESAVAVHNAQPYPFYSHYQQHHHQQHYLQAQQQRAHVVVAGGNHGSFYGGFRSEGSSNRRHSESGSEKASTLTRSEMASAEKYYERRKDRLVSPRLVANHHAQRSGVGETKDEEQIKTRKGPARSLSFADVVVGGNTYSASTMEYHRKEPSSPLARPSRYWRDDSGIEDSINEKWESKR